MRDKVMPLYGNTHTTTSTTGAQTTAFREEAREIIAEAVNAKVCLDFEMGRYMNQCVHFALSSHS